ncbi:hypothetical protein D4Q52_17655 [Rhodopseudomonas palustris]|uniref:DUF5615 domain-containing protein n=1 Tax=Rhodopseudomonas palustris TaxID=1076 RepID=A0A418V2U5_RHOPL|nr:hypothetical protein D4Q52_17655 [Rhodopseudomonas palustris]
MRFLADENIPRSLVQSLLDEGHDVVRIGTLAAGASDPTVLELARREGRVVLTFDKDFGELARASKLGSPSGVVLFRLPITPSDGARLARIVSSRSDWSGHFAVVDSHRVRIKPLPILD